MDEIQKLAQDILAYDAAVRSNITVNIPSSSEQDVKFKKLRLVRAYAELIELSAEIDDLIKQLKSPKSNDKKIASVDNGYK